MDNPYSRHYRQPRSRNPHAYGTRGRANAQYNSGSSIHTLPSESYTVSSNALFEFDQNNTNSQATTQMSTEQPQRNNTTPNPVTPQMNNRASESTVQQNMQYQTPRSIPESSLREQLDEIQTLINTRQVQQNLAQQFNDVEQQGTSKQQQLNHLDNGTIQEMLDVFKTILTKQDNHEQRFTSIENNANALVGDIQNAFINTERKIPTVQHLQGLFQQYTQFIGNEVDKLIKERQLTIQQSMDNRHESSHQLIENNSKDIRNIMSFQQQFEQQCVTFQGMLNTLQSNYTYLQQKIAQQTPEQLSQSKLTTKVYDQVIQRVTDKLNELFHQFQNRAQQTLTTNMSAYVSKEFQRIQTDLSQSIKKQQLYEYGILRKEIDDQRQHSEIHRANYQNSQLNQQEHMSQQMQQLRQQMQQLQINQQQNIVDSTQTNTISQQQNEIDILKQQMQALLNPVYQQPTTQASQKVQQNQIEPTLQQWQVQPSHENIHNQSHQYTQSLPYQQHEIKIDKFRGKSNAELWISKLERQLQLRPDVTDHAATLIALDNLSDQAYRWAFTHTQYYAIHFDYSNSLNNVYSFQAFKKLFLQKYTKPIEDFQGQLLAERQVINQSYDDFAKRINTIASQGNVQESYLKLIFFSNIRRQDVALHLQHIRDDPKYDLLDASREAYFMEEKLNYIKLQDRNKSNIRTNISTNKDSKDRLPRPKFRLRVRPKNSRRVDKKPQAVQSLQSDEDDKQKPISTDVTQRVQFIGDEVNSKQEEEINEELDNFDYEVYDESSSNNDEPESLGTMSLIQDYPQNLQTIQTYESQYEKANKYKFNVDNYFQNKRTDVTLNELFQNSQFYKEQLKKYVSNIDTTHNEQVSYNQTRIQQICSPSINIINVEAEAPNSLKHIYVKIGKQQTLAVLDTGAHTTAISAKFFQSLRLPNSIQENKKRFKLGNGELFTPSAMVRVPIIINDIAVNTQAILTDNVDYNILIGLDFINSIEGGLLGNYFLYKHPQTKLLQSVIVSQIDQKQSKTQTLLVECNDDYIQEDQLQAQQNISYDKTYTPKQVFPLKPSRPWSTLKAPLTRKQKFYVKVPEPLRSKVIEADKNKLNEKYKASYLYPKFPLKNKYQLILIDHPFKYEGKNDLTPQYDVLSQDDLKRLPINQIADQEGSILLQWASGITIDRAIELSKHYGFKHYQIFHTWRKVNKDGTLYTSKQLKPTITSPNNEFLIMSTKANWKKHLKEDRPIVMQELEAQIQIHSKKPSKVYKTIQSIFKVDSINCLEVFATIDKHPYFDVYGNIVPQFFQPSLKVIKDIKTIYNVQQEESKEDKINNISTSLLRDAQLTNIDKVQARNLISKCIQAFALSEYEVGEIKDFEFPIDLVPGAQPFAQKSYTLPEKDKKILKEQIQSWEQLGYIRKQNSEWASPAFLVPKEGGKARVCTDYRYLNVFTIPVHGPIPNISDLFMYLAGMHWISKVELKSSYQNLRIRYQDINKIAFTCYLGIQVCLRILFGQKNSASYFQMAIKNILKPLLYKCVIVYIDDILIYSPTLQQHFIDLQAVFDLLIKGNVKLHCEKSSLFLQEVDFLGHTIKDGKYYPRPKKSGVLQSLQPPVNKSQLKSFLGLIGFYRKFVQNFSIIATPLNDQLKKEVPFKWTEQCQQAFEYLKERVVELPALYLPDNKKTYYLSTDFCSDGIAAVLSQKDHDNNEYPIEFASRSLNVHEKKYGSYEGEILAVIWALQKFRHMLINSQFILYTDNKALSQVLQKQNPSLKIQRWLQVLNDFSFLVIHRSGKLNTNADAISRLNPLLKKLQQINALEDTSYEPIDIGDIACRICRDKSDKDMLICELCSRGFHSYCVKEIPNDFPDEYYYCQECLSRIRKGEVKDLILDFHVLNYVKTKQLPEQFSPQEKQRVLKRAKQLAYDQEQKRFLVKVNDNYKVIPTIVERRQIIQQNHDNSSHPGALRTCSLILQRYYWRNIQAWVKQHINKCALCIANRSKFTQQQEYIPPTKGKCPGQYWAIDLATNLPTTKEGYKHFLVLVDAFSKWVDVIELKSKESKEITEKIHRNIISTFGKPLAFRSDRGGEFKGVFDEFCKALSITHDCTYPNHPRGNGQAESLVKFTIELLKRTIHQRQFSLNEWVKCIPTVLYTLRFSNSIANIPPYEVVFGRTPNTISPLDMQLKHTKYNVTDEEVKTYARQLAQSQKQLYPRIKQFLEDTDKQRQEKYKQKYTQPSTQIFEPNQMVFRNSGQRTTKLQLSSQGPYVFIAYKGPTGAIIQDPVTTRQYEVNKYDLVGVPKLTNDPLDLQPQDDEDEKVNDQQSQSPKQRVNLRGRPRKAIKRGRPRKN